MKKIIITALLFVSVLQAGIGADKYKHAYAGIGIYAGCMFLDKALELVGQDTLLDEKTCLIPVVVAAVGKEVYDNQHANHTSDVMDTLATVAIPFGAFTVYKW
jgi:UDP-N-acetylmuramyl pentapeptide phosphotransferase/UDP-N-acetylglucosamine-1-phosphate transferase